MFHFYFINNMAFKYKEKKKEIRKNQHYIPPKVARKVTNITTLLEN